jgi:hypothetical protein
MNLSELAESDLVYILEDQADGLGTVITITSPAGTVYTLIGINNDIGQPRNEGIFINTGEGVGASGRFVELTLRISTILSEIGSIPNKSEHGTGWLFKFANVNLEEFTFAIEKSDIDRKLGVAKFILGLVKTDNGS